MHSAFSHFVILKSISTLIELCSQNRN